ncbi:Polyphosphate kinase 2 [hydrothermal vent metagenome]|uniref:Polyphosphate kinase 2 n=1 Tax=hydrothermal vent metagenome TaxID=652676 RepID=A0A3B0T9P2_9ZZZZ
MNKMETLARDWTNVSLEDKSLPDWIVTSSLKSGGYPYAKRLRTKTYLKQIYPLHIELQKVQQWVADTGQRVVAIFEGRDTAGKGGTIKRYMEHLNPRQVRVVALPKPTDRQRGEWYFQRYAEHLPTAGEMCLFDRSWYNRAVIEPVMGFCSAEQTAEFLDEAPKFEAMLVRSKVRIIKFWLTIGREEQMRRLHARRHDPLKQWKLSPIDIEGLSKWDDYTAARKIMFAETDTATAPWMVIKSNDKKRARINCLRHFLMALPYEGKDLSAIGEIDEQILGTAFDDMD